MLKSMPDRMAKTVLAGLLEESALLQVLLEEAGGRPPLGEAHGEELSRVWDRVEEGRDARAGELLHNLMRMES
jgi:hypothetical protein